MERYEFKHSDRYANKYKKSKYIFVAFGIFWTIVGIWKIASGDPTFYAFFFLLGGPLFVVQSFITERSLRENFLIIDDTGVKLKTGRNPKQALLWNEIELISYANQKIKFTFLNSRQNSINISRFSFDDRTRIKQIFKSASTEKNIRFQ
ncbi:MAG: hypothetical protein JW995_07720 [Melioribacteraceae bacterium]|nr:hypothetical protein [Melioribacteraceae bacterium]